MKKNITINLCGRLYQIDEDAYDLLSHYTDSLRKYFLKQEGGEEIANDIESRIAELFDELKAQGIEAITITNVQNIIQQIGDLKDIAGDEEEQKESATTNKPKASTSSKPGKKLFRDPNDKVIAGVCSGVAQYFGHRPSTWRWCYGILLVVWLLVSGVNPFTLTGGMMSSFSFLFFIPTLFVVVPLLILPVLPYVIGAIFIPEASTAEQTLQMKGKEVTPQSLADEVTELNTKKANGEGGSKLWNIIGGVCLTALSFVVGIVFLTFLCLTIAMAVAPKDLAYDLWRVDAQTVEAFAIPSIITGIILVAHIGIILYCCIHGAWSSFRGRGAMSTTQRIIWFVAWVISLGAFVGSIFYTMRCYHEKWDEIRTVIEAEEQQERDAHTHYGFYFNDTDWQFFNANGYTLSKAQDCSEERYTYIGEYMTGDESVRYLDACNPYGELIYTVFKTDSIEPGMYRLSAAVKAENEGGHIYAQLGGIDSTLVASIPAHGIEGGNIWEYLTRRDINPDPKVVSIINRLSALDKEKIKNAHNGSGYGWSYVYMDSIEVKEPTAIVYGVTTDPAITGKEAPNGWVSATDFYLERY